ncbi:MAG TPA: DUF4097 family beta strand repeat-containing protein [Candidatus Lustribacter sp.]|nr:DUF4097 family beta strand repeat-containing protein [Candidatus Lustribacter sp.]
MTNQWSIEGPKVLDIGDEGETVRALKVSVVGGRVDVVTHDDSPTARVEVTSIEGPPLKVMWNGDTLRISHGEVFDQESLASLRSGHGGFTEGTFAKLRQAFDFERAKVTVSISVPVGARAKLNCVSAAGLLSGLRGGVKVNTVSGSLALTELSGATDLNSVSGNVECVDLDGDLKINTVSGAITVQASRVPVAKITTVSGDIALDLTNNTASITSNSVSGDVTVRVPQGGYAVEANTFSGQVVANGRTLGNGQRGPVGSTGARHTEGDGALRVQANSMSGNIVILTTAVVPQDAPQDAPPADAPADSPWQQDEPR